MNRLTIAVATIAFGLMLTTGRAESQVLPANTVDWSGLWVAERDYGPQFGGPVDVQVIGSKWVARIQDETAMVKREVNEDGSVNWSFDFQGEGKFAGWQVNDTSDIEGHWIQPSGVIANYPLATPVRLSLQKGSVFTGRIRPYVDTLSLNVPLFADADSPNVYKTFLRNPERNFGVYFRIETATVDGNEITFAGSDGTAMETATVTEPGERFVMPFGRTGETLEYTRRDRDDAPGFYPRRHPVAFFAMPRPIQTDDGWPTTTPAVAGLDESLLLSLVNSLATFEPNELRQPYIQGLLIAHRGKLIVDEYFHGFDREATHDSRSSTKSLTSALLGVALYDGAIKSIDQPVYPLFGGVDAFENPDPRKARLTLRHLVTMSSGLDCDDGDYDSPGNEDVMQSQDAEPDWYQYALDLAMVREPGEAGVYCTAGMNLIGGALQKATGVELKRYFAEKFAEPLNFGHYEMNLSPTEHAYMGGGMRLRPRDFLKLGQLYLDGGVWAGQRIVSEDYVKASAAPHASINQADDYGYAWWRQSFDVDGRSIETYYASGNGGQLLFVVPELDLVALIQAGNYSDGRTRNAFRDKFMQEHILPAVLAE